MPIPDARADEAEDGERALVARRCYGRRETADHSQPLTFHLPAADSKHVPSTRVHASLAHSTGRGMLEPGAGCLREDKAVLERHMRAD